jgi:hypothetical protein
MIRPLGWRQALARCRKVRPAQAGFYQTDRDVDVDLTEVALERSLQGPYGRSLSDAWKGQQITARRSDGVPDPSGTPGTAPHSSAAAVIFILTLRGAWCIITVSDSSPLIGASFTAPETSRFGGLFVRQPDGRRRASASTIRRRA